MRNTSIIFIILAVVGMAGCKEMEIGLDDETRDAVDCIVDRDACHDDNTSGGSLSDTGDNNQESAGNDGSNSDDNGDGPNSADVSNSGTPEGDDTLDGFVIIDGSHKGDQRYLMGTYINFTPKASGLGNNNPSWPVSPTMRAYAHLTDELIDFEDANGNLLWIATMTDDGFAFTSEVTINNIERDFSCSCQMEDYMQWTYGEGWQCECKLDGSSTKYAMSYTRIGLDANEVYDDDYEGIDDNRNYSLDSYDYVYKGLSCSYYGYTLPDDVTVNYRGRNIDFEDESGDFLWSGYLHEDLTFDFNAGGFPDEYGRPIVDLTCTCGVVGTDITQDNRLYCYCSTSEGTDCNVGYN